MADMKIKKNGNKNTLDLSGELNINCAQELKNALVQTLKNADHVVLNLADVTGMDLSCLQLLCSAHKTSAKSKKSFVMNAALPDALKDAVKRTGYSGNFNCTAGTVMSCLWKGI
jgi:anti-anti-sigma factor